MRFLILATDGLWDEMSPSHAVALVGAYLAGLRTPAISRASLAARVPTRVGAAGILGKDASVYAAQGASSNNSNNSNSNSSSSSGSSGGSNTTNGGDDGNPQQWTFVDANPSVHLIRNALGGADTGALRRVMSIPAPQTRRFRDDMTVTVVWWEEEGGGAGNANAMDMGMKMGMREGTGMGVGMKGTGVEIGVGQGEVGNVKAKL